MPGPSLKVTTVFALSILLSCYAFAGAAAAQPTLDHLLATVNVNGLPSCSSIQIRLNRPASYLNHFPAGEGSDLAIRIEPLATTLPDDNNLDLKEAASVAPGNVAGLTSVSFDPFATSGPVVRLEFSKTTAFRVMMDKDTRLLRVDVSPPGNAAKCLGRTDSSDDASPKADQSSKGDGLAAGNAAATLKEGNSLLAAGDFGRAALFFTKAVTNGSGRTKQDAQEMLGLARERAGQLAHATGACCLCNAVRDCRAALASGPVSLHDVGERDSRSAVIAQCHLDHCKRVERVDFRRIQAERHQERPPRAGVLASRGSDAAQHEVRRRPKVVADAWPVRRRQGRWASALAR